MAGKRTYEHRHMITRTVTTTTAKVTYFNREARKQEEKTVILQGKVTEEAFYKRAAAYVDGMVLVVEDVTINQKLYGATIDDFLTVAKEIK